MPQFCPTEKTDPRLPTIYVSRPDLFVVLNRLLKLRASQDRSHDSESQRSQYFAHFTRSCMRREEFKLAVDIFGYRDVDLPPVYAQASLQTLKTALEGRGK